MRRFLLPLFTVLALAAAAPAAQASSSMLSVMMDDDQLLYRGDDVRDTTLRRMKVLGVDHVRVTVLWSVVAEHAKKSRRGRSRRNFRADNPQTYPRLNWDRYDRLVRAAGTLGLGVYFNLTGPGPRWAHRKPPRSARAYAKYWKPEPREFFKFVKAVGRRYDGTYRDENDGRRVLPAVRFWSIWNEPNQNGWLLPQWEKGVAASPVLYRELWYYGRVALDATGHGDDIVLAGETAPLGSSLRNMRSPIHPKRFIRELFCLDSRNVPYTGASARKRKCSMLEKIGPWRYTAWAHHPYTKLLAPWRRDRHRDSITMANIGELSTLLDTIGARTGLTPKTNYTASTEFGYETNPPDRFVGVSPRKQADYINIGDYLAWKDRRLIAQSQFLLRDVPGIKRHPKRSKKRWFTYQSGLYTAKGKPKPAAAAYLLPFHVVGKATGPGGQPGVNLWGWVRFLSNVATTEVELQFKPQGSSRFTRIGDPVPVNALFGFFTAHRPMAVPGTWRAVWSNPYAPAPVVSREVFFRG